MTIYGVDEVDVEKLKHPFATLGDTPEEWRGIFGNSLQSIRTFLAAHDGFEVPRQMHQSGDGERRIQKREPALG